MQRTSILEGRAKSRIVLRPYQKKAVTEALKKLRSGSPTLIAAPTGSGKTVIAARIARRYPKALLVAHRMEIVEQARASGLRAMSVQTALRSGPKKVDLLVIDEAHRSAAVTYRQLIKRYATSARLGLTATPLRTDGQGLGDAFSALVVSTSMAELVAAGHLVPYRAFEAPDEVLSQLKFLNLRGGDYAIGELSKLMNQPRLVGDVVSEYRKHAAGRKAVVFAVSVEHSQHLAAAFNAAGIRAIHIDGRAREHTRTAALKALAHGDIEVLCNVNLFTEGWDCPPVSCVIMARPTTSLTLYLQAVGRGMRPCEGKADLIILDHSGNIDRHGVPEEPREWSLEGKKEKARREAEIAELERLHALGFASIEAELEEKRRIHAATYSFQECAALLGTQHVWSFLSLRGVRPYCGRGSLTRYSREAVNAIVQSIAASYSREEVRELLGSASLSGTVALLKRHGICRIKEKVVRATTPARYSKAEIDGLVELMRNTYSWAECAAMFRVKRDYISEFLVRRGVSRLFGTGHTTRFQKEQVDSVLASLSVESYSGDECRDLIRAVFGWRCVGSQLGQFLKRYGIKSQAWKRGGPRKTEGSYQKKEIDDLLQKGRDSYPFSECSGILGLSRRESVSLLFRDRGIKPLIGKGPSTRYAKSDIDRMKAEGLDLSKPAREYHRIYAARKRAEKRKRRSTELAHSHTA